MKYREIQKALRKQKRAAQTNDLRTGLCLAALAGLLGFAFPTALASQYALWATLAVLYAATALVAYWFTPEAHLEARMRRAQGRYYAALAIWPVWLLARVDG